MTELCVIADDHGRAAVYAAEEHAFGGTEIDSLVPWRDIERIARRLVTGPWWSRAGGPVVEVRAARASAASSSAVANSRATVIRVAAEQQTLATLAHELAHAVAGVGVGHGPTFRAAHVSIVETVDGTAAAARLLDAYRAFGLTVPVGAWPRPVRGVGDGFVWRAP